ncbi:MAG: choice-of-anchor A family protein, partial [Phycisphaerales bacterium]|nr:choice-of-anchor A family protein [Phycisphaerales bacterium]
GSAMIGGNLSGTSNYAVQGVTSSTGDGLVVGGNLGGGFNYQINNGGNLRISGSVFGTANLNGGGSTISDPSVSTMVNNAMTQAEGLSAFFAGFGATGSVDGAGNMNASTTTVNGQQVAFYSMTQADINGLGQLNLNMGGADTVVINFDASASGGTANFNAPPNLIGGFNQTNSSHIVWNFLNTTALNINNSFNGMILATDADLALTGGGINGSVFVDNISIMNAEIRRSTYTGVTPAPGTLGALTLAGLIASRRRRAA